MRLQTQVAPEIQKRLLLSRVEAESEMTRFADCPFVLWVGHRRMIKRELFDEYIEKMYDI